MSGVRRWALLAASVALSACSAAWVATGEDADTTELVVFAAASLVDAFTEIGEAFSAAHPAARVRIAAAGSHTLARQIAEGAPADVFAAADAAPLRTVADHLAGPPQTFATTRLAIAVEAGNPRDLRGLADLARSDLVVVLPAEEVPAGAHARAVLDAAGVTAAPASRERDVRAALARVALGEADAALVYESDVASAADRVDGVEVAAAHNVRVAYPIATLTDAGAPELADAFVAYVRGRQGQAILARHGFLPP